MLKYILFYRKTLRLVSLPGLEHRRRFDPDATLMLDLPSTPGILPSIHGPGNCGYNFLSLIPVGFRSYSQLLTRIFYLIMFIQPQCSFLDCTDICLPQCVGQGCSQSPHCCVTLLTMHGPTGLLWVEQLCTIHLFFFSNYIN